VLRDAGVHEALRAEPFELIFLDIGSLDGTAEYLAGLQAELVRADADRLDLKDACKQALRQTLADYVVFVHHFGTRTFAHGIPRQRQQTEGNRSRLMRPTKISLRGQREPRIPACRIFLGHTEIDRHLPRHNRAGHR
jgi:hypothetical protein